jgi:hypothetical protein
MKFRRFMGFAIACVAAACDAGTIDDGGREPRGGSGGIATGATGGAGHAGSTAPGGSAGAAPSGGSRAGTGDEPGAGAGGATSGSGGPDAGAPDARSDAGGSVIDDAVPPPGQVRAAVGVGYGGIRVVSKDGGKSWQKTGEVHQHGGDDGDLLRAVAWGNGLWVAGGWSKWWTSPDGVQWTMRPHGYGIIQGLAHGNGIFLATSIDGEVYRSVDGLAWTRLNNAGTGKHSRVVFGNGAFAVSGDPGFTVSSPDGTSWKRIDVADVVAFCDGQFKTNRLCYGDLYNAGFWIPGLWLREIGGQLQRSSDGKAWTSTYREDTNGVDDMAIGWAPP